MARDDVRPGEPGRLDAHSELDNSSCRWFCVLVAVQDAMDDNIDVMYLIVDVDVARLEVLNLRINDNDRTSTFDAVGLWSP
jgi:hypothetical protein